MSEFWSGFLLGAIALLCVCGYFYLKIQARHDGIVQRLEASIEVFRKGSS